MPRRPHRRLPEDSVVRLVDCRSPISGTRRCFRVSGGPSSRRLSSAACLTARDEGRTNISRKTAWSRWRPRRNRFTPRCGRPRCLYSATPWRLRPLVATKKVVRSCAAGYGCVWAAMPHRPASIQQRRTRASRRWRLGGRLHNHGFRTE